MFGSCTCNPPPDSVETYFYRAAVTFIVTHVFTCSLHVVAESELDSLCDACDGSSTCQYVDQQ